MNEGSPLRLTTHRPRALDLLLRTRQHDFRRILDEQAIRLAGNPLPRPSVVSAPEGVQCHGLIGEEPIGRLPLGTPVPGRGKAEIRLRPQTIRGDGQSPRQSSIAKLHTRHFVHQRELHRTTFRDKQEHAFR